MISQLTETNECETAAGPPGRAVIVLLILAALLVVATSVVIAVRGTEFINPGASQSAPPPVVTAIFTGLVAKSARPVATAARRVNYWRGESGFEDCLRDLEQPAPC